MTQVMAHRGASRVEVENTTMAFRRAREMGAQAVELDVRRCASGELVVNHGAKLPDGRAIIATIKSDLPSYIPTLAQALDSCDPMWVNIEIKNDSNEPDFDPTEQTAQDVVNLLKNRSSPDRWLISSFRRETIDTVRALWPELKTAWLVVRIDPQDLETVAEKLAAQGHHALHPWVNTLTHQLIEVFHSHGLQINTWTCDDPVRIRELIDWGIDGICTNVPDIALKVIADK